MYILVIIGVLGKPVPIIRLMMYSCVKRLGEPTVSFLLSDIPIVCPCCRDDMSLLAFPLAGQWGSLPPNPPAWLWMQYVMIHVERLFWIHPMSYLCAQYLGVALIAGSHLQRKMMLNQ